MPRPSRFEQYVASLTGCAPLLLALAACAGTPTLPNDPFNGATAALTMVPVNHTDRYAMNVFVDKYWAGDVYPHAGGGAAACCYPGLKDWSQPVTVRWTWADESAKDDQPAKAAEKHSVVAHFPLGGPRNSKQERAMSQDERYLCVILRDLVAAELAFSVSGSGCASQ